ncbi:MAG: hypothetical protein AB7K71_00450 [Polyangiaceae bacterium]
MVGRERMLRSGLFLSGVVGLALLGGVACNSKAAGWSTAAPSTEQGKAKKAPRWVTPARMVVLPEGRESSYQERDVDGSLRIIAYGLRMLEHQDGSLEVAEQTIPDRLNVKPLELPPRLGGGFIFYSSGSRSLFWTAKTWLGKLKPAASFSADINWVTPGFDRIYLSTASSNEILAVDPLTWQPTDLGPLPPAPGYGTMAFAGEWVAAVESDVRGVLITLDAGASWRPLEVNTPPSPISVQDDKISINSYAGRMLLDSAGQIEMVGRSGDDSAFNGAVKSALPGWADMQQGGDVEIQERQERPLGDNALRVAALGGWPDTKDSAVVMAQGSVARVRLSDGKLLDIKRDAYAGAATCQGAQVGVGIGFICGDPAGQSVVYSVSPSLELTPIISFSEPRYIAASGTGGLVIRGGCKDGAAEAQDLATTYCIRSAKGKLREVRVRGDRGVERVVSLQDGRVAVVVPPRLGAPGTLLLIAEDGSNKAFKLSFKEMEPSTKTLLKKGLWLDGLTERVVKRDKKKVHVLAGWVAGGGPFVGIQIDLDGKVAAGEIISEDIDRSLLSGRFGLAIGRGGLLRETIDGGFSWSEVAVPPAFGDRSSPVPRLGDPGGRSARGCSPVGCAFGTWLRVGWQGRPVDEADQKLAELPERVSLPSKTGSRWTLECTPAGQVSVAGADAVKSAPQRPAPPGIAGAMAFSPLPYGYGSAMPTAETLTSSSWAPFLGVKAPNKGAAELGFDFGNDSYETRMHAYTWGPRGKEWSRLSRWVVRVEDAFSLTAPLWNTAAARPDWPDPVSAAMSFGQLSRWGGYATWRFEPEPRDDAGLLVLNVRGTQTAYVLERDRAPLPIQGSAMWALNQVAGAVKVQGTWYFGSTINSQAFRIYRLNGDELDYFADYPMRPGSVSQGVQLVKSTQGDALGILTKVSPLRGSESRWFVFPVDTQSKDAGEPLEISSEMLGTTPRRCGPEDDGWSIVSEPPVQPYLQLEGTRAVGSRVQAKFIADASGLCVEALAATTSNGRAMDGVKAVPGAASSVGLALSERGSGEGRWAFRCKL